MTMWTFLVLTCVVLIVIRFAMARCTGPGRWLSATLVAFLPAMVLQVPGVSTVVDEPTIPGLASALANAFTILTLALANRAFQLTVDPARRATVWLGLVISAVILLAFLVFGSNYAEFLAAEDSARPVPPVGVHTYVYVVSLLWMAAGLTGTG